MYNATPMPQRFWEKADKQENGCWLWTAAKFMSGGVMNTAFKLNGKMWRAPRLAYTLANGPIPDGMIVCHSCDEPLCINPSHLWVGSWQDNMDDMFAKKRNRLAPVKGEKHSSALLTEAQVKAIRHWLNMGRLQKDLAKRYKVAASTISAISRRRTWKHI